MSAATAQEIFSAMDLAVDDKVKRKFNATALFVLDGVEHHLDATKDGATAAAKDKPDLIVTSKLSVFHDLLAKKLTPQQAFMQGKLKIKGNMGLAMKLTLVMNATRKQMKKPRSKL
mmetsp:Transcript_6397/g.17443  ORF Transcript_6397/g.17443 Transcript_6397/m.17443 type:complete len:116 (-) Transcript_6397:912-1259(-)|eukprot:CAMPEP_0198130770 /NCGR_PEP_ID=MMETSP1442-20131203/54669_1 /TAXON_ID= /ORGANISM="Craspedostauros australis, Strain CCMP3328" /LENGTH=115 /DNA_ID=CAMNT_0043791459 /DNA_START=88 /DNA_END=435 /DNA_ORIENTATION=+